MRIIAGTAKGTRLAPVPSGTRPVSDRAREGLFSSLGPSVVGAAVLDLYAGTGALGIEALSRGAEHATFVELARGARRAIEQNLERTHLAGRASVIGGTALNVLTGANEADGPFNLILLDPPYGNDEAEVAQVLAAAAGKLEAGSGWTVVLTRPKESSTPVIPVNWRTARRLEYGDSLVICYREAEGG